LAVIAIGGAGRADRFAAITFRLKCSAIEACYRDSMPLALDSLCRGSNLVGCGRLSYVFGEVDLLVDTSRRHHGEPERFIIIIFYILAVVMK
jgi:hypothetical protein